MKIAEKVSHDRLRRMAHEQFVRRFPDGVQQDAPEILNADEAVGIDQPVVFAYRGKPYVLPPIPFEAGVELHGLMVRIHWPESDDQYLDACRAAVRLMGRLAHRRGWRRWITFRNPFRSASEKEIRDTLDFFWTCRTGHRYLAWVATATAHARSTTSRAGTSSSSRTTDRPDTGATTSTA